MQPNPLLVVIIETPNSERSRPLINSLAEDDRFLPQILPATMIRGAGDVESHGIKLDLTKFKFFQKRELSFPEIGCAFSHNLARGIIANSTVGGVILEDDARIANLDDFYRNSVDFLRRHGGECAVLSLTFSSWLSRVLPTDNNSTIRLFGTPPLAAANVLTKSAANNLLESNKRINTVADWPYTPNKYYYISTPSVLHGDVESGSVIDPMSSLNRKNSPKLFKLRRILLLDLNRARKLEITTREYCTQEFYSRFASRLDAIGFRSVFNHCVDQE
jgi:hypothetical protein